MIVEIEGYGEVEAVATAYTLVVYEQEFKSDLIKDVFGRTELAPEDPNVLDFTEENWMAELKALWAMARTAYDLKAEHGLVAPADRPKPFPEWVKRVGKVNFRDIANSVVAECLDGFFHTGAAASE